MRLIVSTTIFGFLPGAFGRLERVHDPAGPSHPDHDLAAVVRVHPTAVDQIERRPVATRALGHGQSDPRDSFAAFLASRSLRRTVAASNGAGAMASAAGGICTSVVAGVSVDD